MSRRSHRQRCGHIPNRPAFEVLRNPYRPTKIQSEESVEVNHQAALQILKEAGLDVWGSEGCRIFKQFAAQVDEAGKRVRLDRGLVLKAVFQAPGRFTLYARNPVKNLSIGGDGILFGAVGGPPFVSDLMRPACSDPAYPGVVHYP